MAQSIFLSPLRVSLALHVELRSLNQLAKNCLTQEIPAQSSAKTLPEMLISIIITFDIIIIT